MTVRIQGKEIHPRMDVQRDTARSRTFGGYGADTDIIVASARAYLNALNKLAFCAAKNVPPGKVGLI